MYHYEEKRILIWGKTYPELSKKYAETVCTGGVTEDGSPIRLYPIPYRYLEDNQRFAKYQWVTLQVAKETRDLRPESYRVRIDSLMAGEKIPTTTDEWGKRAELVLKNPKWIFDSLEDLQMKQAEDRTSLGVVTPKEILGITIQDRTEESKETFEQKMSFLMRQSEAQKRQLEMFEEYTPQEFKGLDFVPSRLKVRWKCYGKDCQTHHTQILDWEIIEAQRKFGMEKAKEHLENYLNLDERAIKFFMGNIHIYPTAFTIVGLWYPKKAASGLFW